MGKKKQIVIQSMSDMITNSSSEVFIVQTDKSWQELEDLIKSWQLDDKDEGSGMGGCIEVYDSKRPYADKEYISDIHKEAPHMPWIPEGHLAVHIDWNLEQRINKLFEDFDVVDSEDYDLILDHTTMKSRKFKNYEELYKQGLKPCEEYLPAGSRVIFKARLEYGKRLQKEMEDAINKVSDMETAKKFWEMYSSYLEGKYEEQEFSSYDEDLDVWKEENEKLHKIYEKNQSSDNK